MPRGAYLDILEEPAVGAQDIVAAGLEKGSLSPLLPGGAVPVWTALLELCYEIEKAVFSHQVAGFCASSFGCASQIDVQVPHYNRVPVLRETV
jgi:hypothetical protein